MFCELLLTLIYHNGQHAHNTPSWHRPSDITIICAAFALFLIGLILTRIRYAIRKRDNIPEHMPCEDLCCTVVCCYCSMCQMLRHVGISGARWNSCEEAGDTLADDNDVMLVKNV